MRTVKMWIVGHTVLTFSNTFLLASGTPAFCFSEQVPQNRPNAYLINLFITNALPRGVFQTQNEDNSCYRNTKLSWRRNLYTVPFRDFTLAQLIIQSKMWNSRRISLKVNIIICISLKRFKESWLKSIIWRESSPMNTPPHHETVYKLQHEY